MKTRNVLTPIAAVLLGVVAGFTIQPAAADGILNWLMGGDITINEKTVGDVVTAERNVNINADVTGDVVVGGGNLRIAATVKGHVSVVQGNLELTSKGVVDGGVSVLEGDAAISGIVKGNVDVTSGLDAKYEAKHGKLGKVTVAEGARIGGKLIVEGPVEPTVAPGATIAGGVEYTKKDK